MLSVLVPVYNYNAYPLIEELHKQCVAHGLPFEIIVIDDASSEINAENNQIKLLSHCKFVQLSKNIGRSKIRNLLASDAKYQWLLFLDCDTFPEKSEFVSNYINQISNSTKKTFFGGLIYSSKKPLDSQLLRWTYGRKREARNVDQRIASPYNNAFVSNMLIDAKTFQSILFDEEISNYGYEDFAFIQKLKSGKVPIAHIDNPVFHINLENSHIFLAKTMEAVETLSKLSKSNSVIIKESKIAQTYLVLHRFKIDSLIATIFQKSKFKLESHLTSAKPSLMALDFYKIGYFCYINSK